jgi:hypothetical protein
MAEEAQKSWLSANFGDAKRVAKLAGGPEVAFMED